MYGPTLDVTRDINDKPIAITEFGTSSEQPDGGHDPERKENWLETAYEFVEEQEDVLMTLYFNFSKEMDWAVFNGEHGADTTEIGGNSYNVYPAYRDAITQDGVLGPHPDHPRILTDDEFAGEF